MSATVSLVATDFRRVVVDFLKKYCDDAMHLGAPREVAQERPKRYFPTALHSIKESKILWSRHI